MHCSSNSDEFQCKFNECIKWSYVCDGVSHCSNRADEDCDMCTNDFYICKDSSRINCTLACSTLGYIPCKNYVDKKICASVNKKLSSSGSSFFRHHLSGGGDSDGRFKFSNLLGRSFKSDEGNAWITTLIGSSLLVVSVVLILGLLFMFHKRKRKKQSRNCNIMASGEPIDDFQSNIYNQLNNSHNLRFNSLSHNPTLCYDDTYSSLGGSGGKDVKFMSLRNPNTIRKDDLDDIESPMPLSKLSESNNYFIDNGILIRKEGKAESDWLFAYLDQFKSVNVDVNINDNEIREQDEEEEEEYAEPPPSYKLAKYYPKATLVSVRKNTSSENHQESSVNVSSTNSNTANSSLDEVVYENIEESSNSQSNPSSQFSSSEPPSCRKFVNSQQNSGASSRRGRFQGLKKHRITTASRLASESTAGHKVSSQVATQPPPANTVLSCTTSSTGLSSSSSVLSNRRGANNEEFI